MPAALEAAFAGHERGKIAEKAGDLGTATAEYTVAVELYRKALPAVREVDRECAELISAEATSLASRVKRLQSRLSRSDRRAAAAAATPAEDSVTARVEDFSEGDPVLFLVVVKYASSTRALCKRFTDFRALEEALRTTLRYRYAKSSAASIPALPRRHSLFGRKRSTFLSRRRDQLSRYIAAVVELNEVQVRAYVFFMIVYD